MSASRVVPSGWIAGSGVVSAAGQRRPVIEGILTCVIARQENNDMSKAEGRKESVRLVHVNLQQNNRRGEVVAHCFNSMVKIPHAEL